MWVDESPLAAVLTEVCHELAAVRRERLEAITLADLLDAEPPAAPACGTSRSEGSEAGGQEMTNGFLSASLFAPRHEDGQLGTLFIS